MFRLVKYLKPFIVFILIAVVFLFIQAMSDLALPEYMSNIVNYGIQQGGITNAVPEAIRQSQMDKITVFMSAEDKNEVMRYYTLFDSASPQFTQYLKEYPQLEKEPVYILGKFSKEETAGINVIMSRAFLAVAAIKQMLQEPAKVAAAHLRERLRASRRDQFVTGGAGGE